ncbi:hypothetical protein L596_027710 [Steinernema carpocapsae]|uniref:Uncharacterized protein n=1 Tax=Steinernema carpocapsae TaxID=34508 RepID=A0A4U5LWB8_STECR|nr:hypothetical protein L596_027710 [Steinernema carpocapsae]
MTHSAAPAALERLAAARCCQIMHDDAQTPNGQKRSYYDDAAYAGSGGFSVWSNRNPKLASRPIHLNLERESPFFALQFVGASFSTFIGRSIAVLE